MKGVVFSLGCKVNQIEGQAMLSKLIEYGVEVSDKLEFADFYVINTCSVTSEADRKSRQTVARVLKLNPYARVYLCGCSTQNSVDRFLDKKNVRIIGGTNGKLALIDSIMSDIVSENTDNPVVYSSQPAEKYEELGYVCSQSKTRAFVKVQDGCNNFCSYCIVPYLRGRSRSRDIEHIINDCKTQAKNANEIVISGINISSYGVDFGSSLVDLVYALKDIPVRKRFSSMECNVISRELLTAMKESNFCEHFHLSLQSGCDAVLKRMNRHYATLEYLDKVELIRAFFNDAGITTDIIAGFPEETESEHNQTLKFIRKVGFSDAHVFPYSERKGTRATKDYKMVDKNVRVRRAREIAEVCDDMRIEFLKNQIGKVVDVCIEDVEEGFAVGYARNYVKVYTDVPSSGIEKLKIKSIYKNGVKGEKL